MATVRLGIGIGIGIGLGLGLGQGQHLHRQSLRVRPLLRLLRHAYMVKRGEIGGCGGGWLEHPRQWLGTQWLGLALGVQSRQAHPGRCRSRAGALAKGEL